MLQRLYCRLRLMQKSPCARPAVQRLCVHLRKVVESDDLWDALFIEWLMYVSGSWIDNLTAGDMHICTYCDLVDSTLMWEVSISTGSCVAWQRRRWHCQMECSASVRILYQQCIDFKRGRIVIGGSCNCNVQNKVCWMYSRGGAVLVPICKEFDCLYCTVTWRVCSRMWK